MVDYTGGRTFAYKHDGLDRNTRVTVAQAGEPARITEMNYWPSGERREITKTNQSTDERFYATDGRLTQRHADPVGANNTKDHLYTYDTNGKPHPRRARHLHVQSPRPADPMEPPRQSPPRAVAAQRSTQKKDPKRTVTYEPAGDGTQLSKREKTETQIPADALQRDEDHPGGPDRNRDDQHAGR